MGPDNLHPRVLKHRASTIAPSLQLIFQKSIATGRVPSDWKQANVSPIFKKGERYNPANYRPVSLTCICSKILEHIITKHLRLHLNKYNILYDLQRGFWNKGQLKHNSSPSLKISSKISKQANKLMSSSWISPRPLIRCPTGGWQSR